MTTQVGPCGVLGCVAYESRGGATKLHLWIVCSPEQFTQIEGFVTGNFCFTIFLSTISDSLDEISLSGSREICEVLGGTVGY